MLSEAARFNGKAAIIQNWNTLVKRINDGRAGPDYPKVRTTEGSLNVTIWNTSKNSSFTDKVELLKAEILYLTVNSCDDDDDNNKVI